LSKPINANKSTPYDNNAGQTKYPMKMKVTLGVS